MRRLNSVKSRAKFVVAAAVLNAAMLAGGFCFLQRCFNLRPSPSCPWSSNPSSSPMPDSAV